MFSLVNKGVSPELPAKKPKFVLETAKIRQPKIWGGQRPPLQSKPRCNFVKLLGLDVDITSADQLGIWLTQRVVENNRVGPLVPNDHA